MKKGYRLLASILALALCLSLTVSRAGFASAEENSSVANRYNVVMVIDKSGSLRDERGIGTDPEGLRYDAMKLFLGLLTETGNNVGAVVFDDQIRLDSGLRPMDSMEDKRALVSEVEALGTSYDTDIGGAMLRATEILHGMQEKNGLPCAILLLTDGMTDFPQENRWLRMQSSLEAGDQALQAAQEEGITIHGILLDVDGRAAAGESEVRRYTDGTDGEFEIVSKPEDLTATFGRFYSIINKTEYTGAHKVLFSEKGAAETGFLVPAFGVEEVNIVVERREPQSGTLPERGDIRVTQPDGSGYDTREHEVQTSRFLLVKIPKPAAGDWTVNLRGEPGDSIDVCLIYNSSVSATLTRESEGEDCEVLKPVHFEAAVADFETPLSAENLGSITVELALKNLADGETVKLPMAMRDGVFTCDYTFENGGEYAATASVSLTGIEVHSNTLKMTVLVPPPTAKFEAMSDLFACGSIQDNVWSLDLRELFEDPKGTGLSYALSDSFGGAVTIEDGVLRADLAKLGGAADFTVTATDSYGLSVPVPFTLKAELPGAKLSAVSDVMAHGTVQGNVWSVDLGALFDDPAGEGLRYRVSDDFGGAVGIDGDTLRADLAALGGKADFTVTAEDAHGLSAAIPFALSVPMPEAKQERISEIADLGEVQGNVWSVDLSTLFDDPAGEGLRYRVSDDLGGNVRVEDSVLGVDLAALGGKAAFDVTATDSRGLSSTLPFDLSFELPQAKAENVSDLLACGSITDNVWSVDLAPLFADSTGEGLRYAVSDDFGGALGVDGSVLNADLAKLGGAAAFSVTATDSRGLSSALPFDIAYTLPEAKRDAVSDITALGTVEKNVWTVDLSTLFDDPKGTALRYSVTEDLAGAGTGLTLEDSVLRVDLGAVDGKASFTVTATDEHGMSAKIPFDLAVEMPGVKTVRLTDPLEYGRFTEEGWELPLADVFDDPAGDGLTFALTDDLGGMARIEDGVLKLRLEGEETAAFGVEATDSRGLSTLLPFELVFPAPTAKVDAVSETVKTGLLQDGTWTAELGELFEDPKGSELEFTVSDDLGGAVTLTESTVEAEVDGLGSADFTVTATDDYGLSTEIPVQLVEKDMTWIILAIALLVLLILIVIVVILIKRKRK